METEFQHTDREVIETIKDALEAKGYEVSEIDQYGETYFIILY